MQKMSQFGTIQQEYLELQLRREFAIFTSFLFGNVISCDCDMKLCTIILQTLLVYITYEVSQILKLMQTFMLFFY